MFYAEVGRGEIRVEPALFPPSLASDVVEKLTAILPYVPLAALPEKFLLATSNHYFLEDQLELLLAGVDIEEAAIRLDFHAKAKIEVAPAAPSRPHVETLRTEVAKTEVMQAEVALTGLPDADVAEGNRLIAPPLIMPVTSFDWDAFAPDQVRDESSSLSTEAIIDDRDDRKRVWFTSGQPWRCVCHLDLEFANGQVGQGTGFLISERTVITAAHVLYDRGHSERPARGWTSSITVTPGLNGDYQPFGSVTVTSAKNEFIIHPDYLQPSNDVDQIPFDIGAIILPKSYPVGCKTGYFGYVQTSVNPAPNLTATTVIVAGYPDVSTRQYYDSGAIRNVDEKGLLRFWVDTSKGQSGAPIWLAHGPFMCVIGVSVADDPYGDSQNQGNVGVLFNPQNFALLEQWRAKGRTL
ncbi:MAG TPA: trypsin-like peptidase domain-containing protein [Ardenticatenaceae bacterium]